MTNLNAVFQFGVDNGYLADNPFKGISPLKESVEPFLILFHGRNLSVLSTPAEISRPKIYGVFLFIIGIRPGELCALGWEDIDSKLEQ